jgi:two-component system sensor histidine kinase BaeS
MPEAIRSNMFNSIRAKVLVMILAANTLVVLAIYLANQLAFEKSFSQYVQGTTRSSMIPVIEALVSEIKEQQSVDFIHPGNPDFEAIVQIYRLKSDFSDSAQTQRQTTRERRPPRDAEGRFDRPPPPRERNGGDNREGDGNRLDLREPRFDRPPPPPPREHGAPDPRRGARNTDRLMFKTASELLVLGNERMAETALWIPLLDGDDNQATAGTGKLIGYLGIENGSRVNAQFDELFAKEQQRQFAVIAIVVLLLSFAIAWPFSKVLVKPILTLRYNARQLASGNYQIKLKPKSHDEIGQLARDMNRLADTLSANRNAQRQWIADISHELRTPIAVIRAELEGMMDGLIAMDESAVRSLHEEMTRLTRLVDDLHQLTLADRGALTYTMSLVAVADVLQKTLAKHESLLLQRHFEVNFARISHGNIQGDAERLTQLFDNLMQNTLRYTDSSQENPGQIEVTVKETNEAVIVQWQDSSPSVPADKIDKLFERLYRVESDRNRATGGSGLGLAICNSIVLAHHGEIAAEQSKLGGLLVNIIFYKE